MLEKYHHLMNISNQLLNKNTVYKIIQDKPGLLALYMAAIQLSPLFDFFLFFVLNLL